MAERAADSLKILHILRAPVGGLFRHVIDLARCQTARGHRVGLVADAGTGGANADAILAGLSRDLAFGVTRLTMSRHIGWRDVAALRHVRARANELAADVVHGHGAKGGAYARLSGAAGAIRVYTPHGGSLHYRWASPVGFLYLALEQALMRRTDLMLFESLYGRDVFAAKIGTPRALVRVVHNGVAPAEFEPVETSPQATDIVFVGELRHLKGVDVLIDAVSRLLAGGRAITATIVGDGPDRAQFEAQAERLRLAGPVRFLPAMPACTAFALGRILVVPSRAESLPYIVLEAAAARRPLIATRVGGMGEIFGPDANILIPPDDPAALATAIATTLDHPAAGAERAARLQARIRAGFSIDAMTDAVVAAYREALG